MSDVIVVRSTRRRAGDIEVARSAATPDRIVVLAPTRAGASEILAALRGQIGDDELADVKAALTPDQQEQ